jgi:hypothetical protein
MYEKKELGDVHSRKIYRVGQILSAQAMQSRCSFAVLTCLIVLLVVVIHIQFSQAIREGVRALFGRSPPLVDPQGGSHHPGLLCGVCFLHGLPLCLLVIVFFPLVLVIAAGYELSSQDKRMLLGLCRV